MKYQNFVISPIHVGVISLFWYSIVMVIQTLVFHSFGVTCCGRDTLYMTTTWLGDMTPTWLGDTTPALLVIQSFGVP